MHSNTLKLFTKAIQAQGGTEPQRQMQPITPPMLQKLCTRLSITQAMTVLLCWNAASRWTETAELRREQFLSVRFERNNNLLGTFHEDHSSKSVPTVHVRDHHGSGHKPNSSVCKQPATRATNEHRDSSGDGSPYSRRPRRRIWHALNQERSHHLSISGNSRRPPQLIGSNESLKALERRKSTAVQRQPNNYGKSVRDSEGVSTSPRCIDNVMVQEFHEQVPFLKSYSILCPRRSSKLAKTDDYHIPLHAKDNIPTLNVQKLRKWLTEQQNDRLTYVLDELTKLPEKAESAPCIKPALAPGDIPALIRSKVISKVSTEEAKRRPTMQYMVPFTVLEKDDAGKDRRRFISWTRSDNLRLKDYEPAVPLLHPSRYLYAVNAEVGVKRDLMCGFYQVGLPLRSRAKFRFRAEDGQLYEMNVLPMGHRCAPEIMHCMTAALAGNKDYCSKSHSYQHGSTDIYIDGVRFSGSRKHADEYVYFIDSRARVAGARFKDQDVPPTKQYVFNGVKFDHASSRVCLGPKVVSKLKRDTFSRLTFLELEAAVGRLLYCSSILGVVIPQYHFAIKIVQRRINYLNRHPFAKDKIVDLPMKTRVILAQWRDDLIKNVPIRAPPHPATAPPRHKLFTDASSKGWGAILYMDSGEVKILGAPWPAEWTYEVNKSEAAAVRFALEEFQKYFEQGTCVQLWIDNTSCRAALNRKICKSDGIAKELKSILQSLKNKGICIQAHYISTKLNPADPISRIF